MRVREEAEAAANDAPADDGLIVLVAAAEAAYFHITEATRQAESGDSLAEVLPLVAIALSAVAPICRRDGTPLPDQEVDRLLFRRKGGIGAQLAALGELRIRHGELRKAITLLKEARVAFGRSR